MLISETHLFLLGLIIGYFVLLLLPIPIIKLNGGRLTTEQVGNSLIDRNWLLSILWLTLIALCSALAMQQTLARGTNNLLDVLMVLFFALVLLVAIGLAIARLIAFPETRQLSPHKMLAHRTTFSVPHEKIAVRTEDGVLIKGVHLKRNHKKIVIYIHGGFRSKNSLASVLICQWLSDYYDVLSFDLRGHGESGGYYTGDGKTILDLLAVLKYVKSLGYERIGLVGRSVGAWTAVLQEARNHNVDSLVAAALPYGYISDCPPLKRMWPYFVENFPGRIAGRITRGIRFESHIEVGRPEEEIGNVSPTPLLMVYCNSDPFLGMSHEDILALYAKAKDPKEIKFLEGACHVYETNVIHKYFQMLVEWFGKTL